MTPEQIDALAQIQRLWPGRLCCLIGASALGAHMDCYWRQTYDLDVTVAVSVDELTEKINGLTDWIQHPKLEHQWTSPGNVHIDILPAGPDSERENPLIWPKSRQVMQLRGFRLVFQHAKPMTLAPNLYFYVAPLHVIVFLKIISYLDRPFDRERDLQDLAFVLEEYLPPDDMRRFSDIVLERQIPYPHTSAFILGKDLSETVNEQELQIIRDFIGRTKNPRDGASTQSRMSALGPMAWQDEPEELLARIDALELGLSMAGTTND
jgi:predicted nucleotidyltransferase